MNLLGVIVIVFLEGASCINFKNVTMRPSDRQLYDFKIKNPVSLSSGVETMPIILTCTNLAKFLSNHLTSLTDLNGLTVDPYEQEIDMLTPAAGEATDVRKTFTINSDQFTNSYHLDLHLAANRERLPERIVHAKGTGAEGEFEVTHDVTKYTSADIFSKIGKKTKARIRFSTSTPSRDGSDLMRDFKGLSVKLHNEEGTLDFVCLQTPVYLSKDPVHFSHLMHAFKRNLVTNLRDFTQIWDFITLRPEAFHAFLWIMSDFGVPNGYRKMDAFAIHTYEIHNKEGERYYAKFNFRSEQGLDNLNNSQIADIQSKDLDYYIRDLFDAIANKEYPSWRLEMDVMSLQDIINQDYDPFDVTRLWKEGTYHTVPIGRLIANKQPRDQFEVIDQLAFNPANLVPGIPGPVDAMFKARRLFYQDAHNYRLGSGHLKIRANYPEYVRTYNRDGAAPVKENMMDNPSYYPNSYNGPAPYVDEREPSEKLEVLQTNAVDFSFAADFYWNVLKDDDQRQRLAESLTLSLALVTSPVQKRGLLFMYLIDPDLGKRVEISLKTALTKIRK